MLADKHKEVDDDGWWWKVIDHMKGLSPSGVELEIMNLDAFDFSEEMKGNPNYYVSYL